MTALCPACGQPIPSGDAKPLSPAELDALSAWWHTGTIKKAAAFMSRSERTLVNQLYRARIRNQVHTTQELAQLYAGRLRSVNDLMTTHNQRVRKAA